MFWDGFLEKNKRKEHSLNFLKVFLLWITFWKRSQKSAQDDKTPHTRQFR